MATHPPMPMPPGSRQIPEEIIAMILAYILYTTPENPHGIGRFKSGRAMIAPMARVSPMWRAEVERLLYDHIALFGPLSIVRCFRTIAYGRRGAGRYVKCLHIALQDYDATSAQYGDPHPFQVMGSGDGGRLLLGFARLIRDALFSMRQLTSYNLAIGRYSSSRIPARVALENQFALPFLPLDAPFKLQSFSCVGLSVGKLLVGFLRDQKAIIKFDAPSLTSQYRLGPPVLPGLRTISGTDGLLRRVVPGRPVYSVRCTSAVADAPFLSLVERLRESSCPLKEFILPSVFLTAARDYIPVLANNLPSLESLVVSDHIPASFQTENTNPYEMYKEETFLHALSKFDGLKYLTVYGKPLASAYNPVPSANAETEVAPAAASAYDDDGFVDDNDVSLESGDLQDEAALLDADVDVEQDGLTVTHADIPQPPTQATSTPGASGSGLHQFTPNTLAVDDAIASLESNPLAAPETLGVAPPWEEAMDIFSPLSPNNSVANTLAGDNPNVPPNTMPSPNNPLPQLVPVPQLPQPPALPQVAAQPNPVAGGANQPGLAPQNGNVGPGINITFDLGPGVNAPELGGAFLQQIQAVTAQIVNQLAAPLGNVLQPAAQFQSQPLPQEDVDVDMILDEDPPNPGEFGWFGNAGAFMGLPQVAFGAPGPGPMPPELAPGTVFGGAVHIDAVLQLGPLPGGDPHAAMFPAGTANQPIPPAQFQPGPLPPNLGVPPPPGPQPPAGMIPPWAAAFPPQPGVHHHVVVLGPGGVMPNMLAPAPAAPAPAPAGGAIGANIVPPPPIQPLPPGLLQGMNTIHGNPRQVHEQKRRLDAFQRDQATEERTVLTLWSAYCPSLQRVTFEMDFGRYVIWKRRGQVWKPSYTPSSSQNRRKFQAGRSTPTVTG